MIGPAPKKFKMFLMILFGSLTWSVWLIRNDLVFNNIVINSPETGLFRMIVFMQKWLVLNMGEELQRVEEGIQRMKLKLMSL